ncbi:hypothetical protein QQP08_020126 [Theobroma cacao]|nr:hypothetical protein QQP08_020126 [Theobroma cacao]
MVVMLRSYIKREQSRSWQRGTWKTGQERQGCEAKKTENKDHINEGNGIRNRALTKHSSVAAKGRKLQEKRKATHHHFISRNAIGMKDLEAQKLLEALSSGKNGRSRSHMKLKARMIKSDSRQIHHGAVNSKRNSRGRSQQREDHSNISTLIIQQGKSKRIERKVNES